ncbi:MAG: PEGA domain-containing protein [Spirochaetia bacterium]
MKQITVVLLFLLMMIGPPAWGQNENSTTNPLSPFLRNGDSNITIETTASEDAEESENQSITIDTEPEGASIFLNNVYYGISPLTISDLSQGNYLLRISKQGYHTKQFFLNFDGESSMQIYVELTQRMGMVFIRDVSENTEIYINNELFSSNIQRLPVGNYTLRVRKFGFEDYTATISIFENMVTEVEPEWEEAEFDISNLRATRPVLNPENPGVLGRTEVRFQVTAPGSGRAEILDGSGRAVFSRELGPFTTWNQNFSWDGIEQDGTKLPEGMYTIRISAQEAEGNREEVRETTIEVDYSVRIIRRTPLSGTSGTLLCSTPDVLPIGSSQFSSSILCEFGGPASGGGNSLFQLSSVPINFALRFGLIRNLEILAQTGTFFRSDSTTAYYGSVSAKYRLFHTPVFQSAAAGQVTYMDGTQRAPLSNFRGISLLLPVRTSLGVLSWDIAPQITVSDRQISYTASSSIEPGLYVWGNLRTAIGIEIGNLFYTAVSGNLRTTPFSQGFALSMPGALATEAGVQLYGNQLYLGLNGIIHLSSKEIDSWLCGIELSFLH